MENHMIELIKDRFFELEMLDKEIPQGVNVDRVVLNARQSEINNLLRKAGISPLYLRESYY